MGYATMIQADALAMPAMRGWIVVPPVCHVAKDVHCTVHATTVLVNALVTKVGVVIFLNVVRKNYALKIVTVMKNTVDVSMVCVTANLRSPVSLVKFQCCHAQTIVPAMAIVISSPVIVHARSVGVGLIVAYHTCLAIVHFCPPPKQQIAVIL
jgi:hypothetical protein